MKVRYTPRARADLLAIFAYLDEKSPSGASSVAIALKGTIDLIRCFPEIGRPEDEKGTRVMPAAHYPYLIYWRVMGSEVRIVHIRHAARGQPDV